MIFTGTSFNNYFTVFSSKVNITTVPRSLSEDVDLIACFYYHHMLLEFLHQLSEAPCMERLYGTRE